MYSSKNTMDFMSEMNRLFPKTSENEPPQTQQAFNPRPFTAFNSPVFHPTIGNQSSSSADSTSPESYPDITMPRCETPSFYRRQRPIVGRKIIPSEPRIVESPRAFGNNHNLTPNWNLNPPEESFYSLTPPNYPERFPQNEYELFPTEKKLNEFQTPVKSSPRPIENSANVSPSSSNYSPSFSNFSPNLSNYSPSLSYGNFTNYPQTSFHQVKEPPRNTQFNNSLNFHPGQMQPFQQRSLQFVETPKSGKICTFCKKNGERPAIYMGHCLKERIDNKTVVQCPILRKFVCSTCGATGDNAHTNTYCPTQRSLNNGTPLQSTTIILKNTRVKSNGRRRY